jgi:hypothetical protein
VATAELWERISRVARSIFKEEVKTPLSFYFRVAMLVPVVLGAILLISEAPTFKLQILELTLGFLFFLCLLVAVFAWARPKHLVYGESGHRAELKLEYGTDQHSLSYRDATSLPGAPAPKELGPAEEGQ